MTAILWLRRDLRRSDHPALLAAAADGGAGGVTPAFVVDPELWDTCGLARRRWLAANLAATRESYDDALVLRRGDPAEVLVELAREVGADTVVVTAESEPGGRARDERVAQRLADAGIAWRAEGTPYAVAPGTVHTKSGGPYRVFTPFRSAWWATGWDEPYPDPGGVTWAGAPSDEQVLADVQRLAAEYADSGRLPAGEAAALERWHTFVDGDLERYGDERDRPDLDTTSRMSAYLKLGVVHPRTLLADAAPSAHDDESAATFVSELAWREFYADVLHHRPDSLWNDLTDALSEMVYDDAVGDVEVWKRGETGFPIVDAGMRQLLAEGWMHNRVRMITASFLTKDLHVWWPTGAAWFLEHLIDGDLASNNHGWQWVAGTGTDASPYFRVFNPVRQGVKFDPAGDYVRRWVPELRHLPGNQAHEPWAHPDGYAHGYVRPIVEHAEERREALSRYERTR